MGLLDRLLGNRSEGAFSSKAAKAKPAKAKQDESFYLDADTSSSLGDVNFMRRSNTIRHTFPGNADNPGNKEMIQEVDSMAARLEKASTGMPGTEVKTTSTSLSGGVPKPVKKTFVEKMSSAELSKRLRGAAVGGVNAAGGSAGGSKTGGSAAEGQPSISLQQAKPGTIDAFKDMAKEINS
ncbi:MULTISPECIES: hypothetical protein [unclassified Synechococcus]|uniref:hypothetical protein n=1 Tax=unclassified Synechococcus TaxID=2626047 RepID=UPI0000698D42|nr:MULTISPECIES: hypothetical protein [unclassified Synechococcus]EAQ74521.1 hypothetical protein WH5701_13045 [Synechococcus sp. WH 5701]WFN58499.1 hypothetical protein N4320_11890 [Synechococcus sp. CCFWC 502]CAK6688172.1 hypothetical protein ICNINCKA_00352 [Synechococcus sp. CBW1107]